MRNISCPLFSYDDNGGAMYVKRTKPFIHIAVFIMLIVISFQNHYNPFIINDITHVSSVMEDIDYKDDPLYKKIVQTKEKIIDPPEDAWIDQVWKKTPGRNGITINVLESFQKMKEKSKYDSSLLVYEQVKPQVMLSDLPAAPIYRGHPKKNMVSFFINVSWGTEHIPDILQILKKHQIKATFFLDGKWAREHVDLVKMIDEESHVIGNHAYNHPNMEHLNKQENFKQIKQTNDIIHAIIGHTPKWFAPPSGSYNSEVIDAVESLDMETLLWTVDTIDWKKPSTAVMIHQVMKNIHPGATILMHPTPVVVDGLDELIKQIKEKGYEFGSVEKLLSTEREQIK